MTTPLQVVPKLSYALYSEIKWRQKLEPMKHFYRIPLPLSLVHGSDNTEYKPNYYPAFLIKIQVPILITEPMKCKTDDYHFLGESS